MVEPKYQLSKLVDRFSNKLKLNVSDYPDYHKDASEIKAKPSAILFAESEQDVTDAVKICKENNIPIIFRGAGTGYTGGTVPIKGGLVLSLQKLDNLEIFPEKKMAVCGPGVITIDLMNMADQLGLYYPPDPASYDESTMGGNIAENAGGLHCVKYGVTKDYVIGLKAITADGEILKTGFYSDQDLFDLTGLMLGSEGLLATITEIAVRLIDCPETGYTILAAFGRPPDAAQTVADITLAGLTPAVMEYMDGDAIDCSNTYDNSLGIDNAEALLLLETDGSRADRQAEKISEFCEKNKATLLIRESDRQKANELWKIRRNLSKAVKESARDKIAEDVCVPPSRLPELVNFVARLNNEFNCRVNSYGHAGDGNLHVNFLITEETEIDPEHLENGIKRLFQKTIELGGTLTGEHGIGLTKKKFINMEFSKNTIDKMKSIKRIFDPNDIFNPGKMF